MARWLRVLVALAEDLDLVLAPITICDSSFKGSNTLFWPLRPLGMHRYTSKQNIHSGKMKINLKPSKREKNPNK